MARTTCQKLINFTAIMMFELGFCDRFRYNSLKMIVRSE